MSGCWVSIVVPTFNGVGYLREALASVFAQTSSDWDLIISDDGSDDETRAFLREIERRPRVRVILRPHSGIPAVARNAGLREATGQYVAFLDSDDLWLPQKLERQLDILRARPECRWSYTAFTQVDHQAKALVDERTRIWRPLDGEIFEKVVRTRASIRTSCVMVAREFLMEVGWFDETLLSCEDYDLWMRLALRSPVALVDESLIQKRHHDQNYSRNWAIAYHGRDRSLLKLQSQAGPRWRSLLHNERARNGVQLLSEHARRGESLQAVEAVLRSAPHSWRYPFWWAGLLRAASRRLRG